MVVRFPRGGRGDTAEQPVQIEAGKTGVMPLLQPILQLVPRLRPRPTYLGEGEVALRQLRAPAVDFVEDVDNHADGFVFAGDLLNMEVNGLDALDEVEPVDVSRDAPINLRIRVDALQDFAEAFLHELGHIHPERVVFHLSFRVELEHLVVEVEMQSGEGTLFTVEKLGRLAPYDAVQAGNPLLAVQEQFYSALGKVLRAPGIGVFGVGLPHEEAADGMALVERGHKAADLTAAPHIPALKFRQRDAANIDLIENGTDLHEMC